MIRNLEQLENFIEKNVQNPSLSGDIICKAYDFEPFKPISKKEAKEWIRGEEKALSLQYMRMESVNLIREQLDTFKKSNTPSSSRFNKLIFKNKKEVATPYITDVNCAVEYAYEYLTEKYITLDIIL